MPVIVGASGTGTEGKSDRLGIPTGTSDPSSASAGDSYFNTSTKKLRIYDGASWINAGAGDPDPYWNATSLFLECTSAQVTDDSSFKQKLSWVGSPTFTSNNAKFGTSVDLNATDGTPKYCQITHDSTLIFGTNDFTIDGWVYIRSNDTGINANYRVFQKGANQTNGYALMYDGSELYFGRTDEKILKHARSNWNDGWHHFAIVRWNDTFTLYRDGVSVDTSTSNGGYNNSNTDDLFIGIYPGLPNSPRSNIMVDNFRITTAARFTGNFNTADLNYSKTQKLDLGTSSQNYATSAAQIFSINPEAQSGLYWIKGRSTGMTYPAQIWCDFDHLGGGWMLTHAHKCIDNEGVYEDTFTSKLGTPSSDVSGSGADWQGATDSNSGSFTGDQMWTHIIGSNVHASIFCREEQYSGGSYKETQKYTDSGHGKTVYSKSNFTKLFTKASGAPGNGSYESNIRVTLRNGLKKVDLKQQTVWSSPSVITINNGAIDQDLYYCNGQDGGDTNWCFGLMRGGTPYPRTANTANGGGRNSISRWAIYGIKAHDFPVPNDPFNDGSGVAYYRFQGNYKSIGENKWNGTAYGNLTTANDGKGTGTGLSFPSTRDSYMLIPAFNDGSGANAGLGDIMTGDKEWTFACWFKIDNAASGGKCSLFHGSWGNDHERPGLWVRLDNYKLEYFSSTNGSAWDVDKGDIDATGLGSTVVSKGVWNHVVYTRGSGGSNGYVNGVLDYTQTDTSNLNSSGVFSLAIGAWFSNQTSHNFYGTLDNIRFFNRKLSADEAKRLYNSES